MSEMSQNQVLVNGRQRLSSQLRIGDQVLVKAQVIRVLDGVGVELRLRSKTEDYPAWVREDHVAALLLPEPPAEPGHGSHLFGGEPGEYPGVFIRDDVASPAGEDLRFPRRWRDVAASEWIDWPTAARRGADPRRRLVVDGPRPAEPVDGPASPDVDAVARLHRASPEQVVEALQYTVAEVPDRDAAFAEVTEAIDQLVVHARAFRRPRPHLRLA